MDAKERDIIVKKVLNHLPTSVKPVHYLMDLFKISNESAYRRIRGDMPFSFEEIIRLSEDLGFSIDELVNKKNGVISFNMPEDTLKNRSEAYAASLIQYESYLRALNRNEIREAVMALNHILPSFVTDFENLFNFTYYKWVHQSGELAPNYNFSELIVPKDILAIKDNINHIRQHNRNRTIILSPYIFYNLAREIEYYYRRKLLTEAERKLLKAEILELLSQIETTMQGEIKKPESEINYYLSSLAIEANNSYVRYDKGEVCYFWVYSLPVVAIYDKGACEMQKKWLDSLKKYSTLISRSSELIQGEFFRIQRAYVDDMDKMSL